MKILRRQFVFYIVFAILVATICYPVNAVHANPQPGIKNIAVTRLIDDPTTKKTLFVITTEEDTYHIIVDANVTTVGSETLIDLRATLYNPLNETITASVRIPDTLYDAPFYNGPVTAISLHLDSATVNALRVGLPIVTVVALFLQAVFIAAMIVIAPVLVALKALFFGGPFIWASLPWVLLTLLQDADSVNGIDLYFPTSPASVLGNLIFNDEIYFIRTNVGWWKISEIEVYTDIPIPFDGVWHFVWFSYWTATRVNVPRPPIAEFRWTPTEPVVEENVTFDGSPSFAPSGYIVTYQWSFGDGSPPAIGKTLTYAYHNPGNYDVTLSVTDNNSLTGSKTYTVRVQPPKEAALRVMPDYLEVEVIVGQSATAQFYVGETLNQTDVLSVNFAALDFSKTFDSQTISSGNVTFDKNGITIPKGTWTNVTVAFYAPPDSPTGWYSGNITVTSANGGNSTIFADLFVYGPPIANFTWSPLVPRVGELVTFDASSSIPGGQPIVDYEWNFGDGQTASGLTATAMHTYTSAATYMVTLDVTDSKGLWNTTQEQVHVIRHDVAIEGVVPDSNWVYQGSLYHAGVNVTVGNLGEVPENFTVTLYASNDTATPANLTVGTQQVMDLPPDGTLVLRFIWNSSDAQPCHWYNMTAVASTVQGETDTENNVNSSLIFVKVRLVGDVNGDGKVDLTDVGLAASAFLTTPGDQRWLPWGPYADIDNNGIIDLFDIALIAKNFGKTCA